MDKLPEHVLGNIIALLGCKERARLQTVNKLFKSNSIIEKHELLQYLLRDIISNVGNNYDFMTCNTAILQGLNVSYLLNIYINYAIFFQKVRTYSGITIYAKLMDLDRHNLEDKFISEIIDTFEELAPIKTHDINVGSNYRIQRFLSILNSSHSQSHSRPLNK
jgi:hypothetical protein